jgi:hypothetical protein
MKQTFHPSVNIFLTVLNVLQELTYHVKVQIF